MLRRAGVRIAFGAALCALPICAPFLAQAAERRPDILTFQVALDRAGFSPGVIDGMMGFQTRQAIRGFQEARGIDVTATLDEKTRAALGGQEATEIAEVSDADAAGPFLAHIPDSMAERAKLDALAYTSIEEALAEKYHTSPAKLRALNPGADFAAGSRIAVPAVRPATLAQESAGGWDGELAALNVAKDQPRAAKIVVDKSESYVRVYGGDDALLAQFPASIGSEHDPLPLGQWNIRGVSKLPTFNYNPELFWDAEMSDVKAKLPPGPNGPVGVVWLDLSKEHFGIHGTPEPQTVGRTTSHGCIRLTNWDAAKLAQMVGPGTPAILQD